MPLKDMKQTSRKRYSDIKQLETIPEYITGPDTTAIADWWPTVSSESLRIYEMRSLDFVIIDHEAGIVYAAMCED